MIKTIIIDDEPNCINNLSYYLRYCPEIEIVRTATTIAEAKEIIAHETFQLAFLDIEFCDTTMFNLLDEAENINFAFVFVTAYDRYAVKAFKVEALDYILKPLSKHDVVACYEKIMRSFERKENTATIPAPAPVAAAEKDRKVILRDREHVYVLEQNDLLYLKAMGAYTEVIFSYQGKINAIVVSKTISALEKEYKYHFFRVHKSYLINLKKVVGILKDDQPVVRMTNNETIPVAKRRLHDLRSSLNELR